MSKDKLTYRQLEEIIGSLAALRDKELPVKSVILLSRNLTKAERAYEPFQATLKAMQSKIAKAPEAERSALVASANADLEVAKEGVSDVGAGFFEKVPKAMFEEIKVKLSEIHGLLKYDLIKED